MQREESRAVYPVIGWYLASFVTTPLFLTAPFLILNPSSSSETGLQSRPPPWYFLFPANPDAGPGAGE